MKPYLSQALGGAFKAKRIKLGPLDLFRRFRFSLFGLFLMLASSGPTALGQTASLSYQLANGSENWPAAKKQGVTQAMDSAVALYNQMGEFPKSVTASYNAATPTADGNYNGNIRFGGQISRRVALHELGHVLGVGTHPRWQSMVRDGKWTGAFALAQLRAFDGPDAALNADRQHFWPYGLNFDRESSAENDRRHVLMVAAFRRDLGVAPGQPIRGLIGVGTWGTQAEFRNISVSKAGQNLLTPEVWHDLKNWRTLRGNWQLTNGLLRQTNTDSDARALIGEPGWSDYTLALQARKVSGKEGFLILFGAPDAQTKSWWNLGGWDNTQHKVETPSTSSASIAGRIETARWYDVRIEVQGASAKCYLNGQLVQQISG